MTLLAFAAEHRLRSAQQLIDISCLPGPEQQTCRSGSRMMGWTGRQTDRRPTVS